MLTTHIFYKDIDECADEPEICGVLSTCINNDGSFICVHISGSSCDGETCEGSAFTLMFHAV